MPHTLPQLANSGLQVDIHDGSYLQFGQTTIYQDGAVRRGFIDGKLVPPDWLGLAITGKDPPPVTEDHSQLRRAIIAALNVSLHHSANGEIVHPTAVPELPLVRVKVWRWGDHAYFELYYKNTPTSLIQFPAATTVSYQSTYEHSLTFHRVRSTAGAFQDIFLDGLPHGDIDVPNDELGIFDAGNRPRGRVWKKAALRLYVSTILDQHPFIINALSSAFNRINASTWDSINGVPFGFAFGARQVRYDGLVAKWIGPPTRHKVAYQFTSVEGGFTGQVAIYGPEPGGNQTPHWYTRPDEPRHAQLEFGGGKGVESAFPVAL